VASTRPCAISAPVETIAFTTPDSIKSQKTSPILATVRAPESVITMKQSLSRAIASNTSAASPICRAGERRVSHGADEFVDGAAFG